MDTFGYFKQNHPLLLAFIVLLASTLACQVNLGGPDIPNLDLQTSEEAANSLEEQWQALVLQAENKDGQVTLILTELQLTSLLRSRLAAEGQSILSDPTIQLEDGLIRTFATLEQDFAKVQILVEIQAVISDQGDPSFEIVTAEFGPLPLPEPIKESVESLIAEAFSGSVGPYISGIQLQSIAITDGEMAIVGNLR